MSIFEIIMLLCFGAAWPFSIYKSWFAGTAEGKSLPFLLIVVAGYATGILHKIFFHYDGVIFFYIANMGMVLIDAAIYMRNARLDRNRR